MEVFYIDFGFYETVSIKETYSLKQSFCIYPAQHIQFGIAGMKITQVKNFKDYLDNASLKSDYFFAIVKKITPRNDLEVMLFGSFDDETFSVNSDIARFGIGYIDQSTSLKNTFFTNKKKNHQII